MDYFAESLKMHEKMKGKLTVNSKIKFDSIEALSLGYTPGVAEPCREIAKNKEKVFDYTMKWNSVAVVTDGSAVLGLGNIGAEASLPVMEGKCALFKEFGDVDAFPIAIASQDQDKIIETVKLISPVFGGINLEDISAPRCFFIEEQLQEIGIPVFHDDQHGTAVVVLAALINSCKVLGKKLSDLRVVVSGAGAAGIAISKFLLGKGVKKGKTEPVKEIILCDSEGPIYEGRKNLNAVKQDMASLTNFGRVSSFVEAFNKADVFIGVSAPGIVSEKMVKSMNKNSMVFAMSNPVPEIMPEIAKSGGAAIVGTGRSDFPNQINNALAFPGIFRGALDARAKRITMEMKLAAAHAIANCVKHPSAEMVVPKLLEKSVALNVARAVKEAAP